jgi:hypothetical protein
MGRPIIPKIYKFPMKTFKFITSSLFLTALAACGSISQTTSFLSKYVEPSPTSSDVAKLRVVGAHGMVRAIPNSGCVDNSKPGTGMVTNSDKPLLYPTADLNDRSLDMPIDAMIPAKTVYGTVGVTEVYIKAGEPLTLVYLSNGSRSNCYLAISFNPERIKNYQASFTLGTDKCYGSVVDIDEMNAKSGKEKVQIKSVDRCNWYDFAK